LSATVETTINQRRCQPIITTTGSRSSKWRNNGIFHQLPWVDFVFLTFGRSEGEVRVEIQMGVPPVTLEELSSITTINHIVTTTINLKTNQEQPVFKPRVI
jgi:hypothetical protein